ncbi:MAG: ABC transporter ATP-binding protein [bacterium]
MSLYYTVLYYIIVKEHTMIELRTIYKSYWRVSEEVKALQGVSLTIDHAEFVAVLGASGSGKSTLLNIIGGLDFPDTGEVIIGGQRLNTMKDRDLTLFRRKRIGYIFQFFNLFPHLTVWENVVIPHFKGKQNTLLPFNQ